MVHKPVFIRCNRQFDIKLKTSLQNINLVKPELYLIETENAELYSFCINQHLDFTASVTSVV